MCYILRFQALAKLIKTLLTGDVTEVYLLGGTFFCRCIDALIALPRGIYIVIETGETKSVNGKSMTHLFHQAN